MCLDQCGVGTESNRDTLVLFSCWNKLGNYVIQARSAPTWWRRALTGIDIRSIRWLADRDSRHGCNPSYSFCDSGFGEGLCLQGRESRSRSLPFCDVDPRVEIDRVSGLECGRSLEGHGGRLEARG